MATELKTIKGRPDLVKNEKTGVFNYINTSNMKKLKEAKRQKIERDKAQEKEITNLRDEVKEMKDLLKALIGKL